MKAKAHAILPQQLGKIAFLKKFNLADLLTCAKYNRLNKNVNQFEVNFRPT